MTLETLIRQYDFGDQPFDPTRASKHMKLRKALATIIPYVPGKMKDGAIKMASNENPLGASPKAVARLKTAVDRVWLYPDAGVNRLKDAMAEKIKVKPENLIFGNGSDEILCLIAGAYIEEGLNAVTSEKTFSEYTFATKLFGGTVKYAPMKDGTFQLDEIAGLVDSKTRLIFLCNPNNPTGTTFGTAEFSAFMKKVPSDVLVVSDEAYQEYVQTKDFPDSIGLLAQFPNLIVLRTFSKIYGLAGLRIGYGAGQQSLISDLLKAKTPFNVNLLAQEAALAALEDDEFVQKSVQVNNAGKTYLYREFERLKLRYYPTEANFICVEVKKDCMEVFQKIMDLGITIRPLQSFKMNDWIRVTIGTEDQNRKFISCLEKALL